MRTPVNLFIWGIQNGMCIANSITGENRTAQTISSYINEISIVDGGYEAWETLVCG